MAESEDSSASPDSTTRERLGFVHGEDVLLQHKDGKYYLGTIVEVQTFIYLFIFFFILFLFVNERFFHQKININTKINLFNIRNCCCKILISIFLNVHSLIKY
jgi:hypothetical protein